MNDSWFVWLSGRVGGRFPTAYDALAHCRVIAADPRAKGDQAWIGAEVLRYVGPRGRRHASTVVAYIATLRGFTDIGISVSHVERAMKDFE